MRSNELILLCTGVILATSALVECHPWSNLWAVRIEGGDDVARDVARHNHHEYLGKVEGLENMYMMRAQNVRHRHRRAASNVTELLNDDPAVMWAEQQQTIVRVKRELLLTEQGLDFMGPKEEDHSLLDPVPEEGRNRKNSTRVLWKRSFESVLSGLLKDLSKRFMDKFGDAKKAEKALKEDDKRAIYNDELWPHQWYISRDGLAKHDHGITKVWDMGYTGRGVVVSVLDDGIEWRHSDLRSNYDHNASFDVNDNDDDPTPRYDFHDTNAHGTRCAGEIAMAPHNKKCGVGVAYNARIGGIRCLDGDLTDLDEARALSFKTDYIDIFSSSWGPADDGKTVDGPKTLALEALERGLTKGRDGKGVLYVWASGNGGSKGDNCNCDGYVSHIGTISIGSVSESRNFPWYGEKCASTLAVAYSSGAFQERKIATTDIHDGCTTEHSGTSAAAPIAAGILALVLEANGNMTWRDVQHLITCTAEYKPLADNDGWNQNAAGFLFNSQFGFGVLSADAMVQEALKWETAAEKTVCVFKAQNQLPVSMHNNEQTGKILFEASNCPIRFLEHVQVRLTLQSNRRGMLRMSLQSPHKTVSVLMNPRLRDTSAAGYNNWNLTSVQFWGENPIGQWQFEIQHIRNGIGSTTHDIELILHGTTEPVGCLKKVKHRRFEDDSAETDTQAEQLPEASSEQKLMESPVETSEKV